MLDKADEVEEVLSVKVNVTPKGEERVGASRCYDQDLIIKSLHRVSARVKASLNSY